MTAKLIRFKDLAPGIRHFVFEVPGAGPLDFQPGQFASLTANVNGREITRAYSLAAAPRGDNQFEICLNLVPEGVFSPYLFALEPGNTVELKGILGTFVWREPAMDSILVATGTGVVPYRAMLQVPQKRAITLIYGTRNAQNLLFLDEFRGLKRVHFIPTVTRPDENWTGATGRVQPILRQVLGERRDVQVYACGLREMVDSVRALCKEHGLDRRQIVTEKFD